MTTPAKIPMHSFYGLRDLEEDDLLFAYTTPKIEHKGCLVYELHRQIFARTIFNPRRHQKSQTKKIARLKDYWMNRFSKPWSQLDDYIKGTWGNKYREAHALPVRNLVAGEVCKDPDPRSAGEIYSVKIDWDLTDSEIIDRFKIALTSGWRGERKPIYKKTENLASQLTAMAAQRLFDCKLARERVLDFAEQVFDGKDKFTTEPRIHEASRRFQRLEETFKITKAPDGGFWLSLDPRAYRLKAS